MVTGHNGVHGVESSKLKELRTKRNVVHKFLSVHEEHVEFLNQRRSEAAWMDCRHTEDLRGTEEQYQRKKSGKVLKAYSRCVLGWGASEETGGGVEHDRI